MPDSIDYRKVVEEIRLNLQSCDTVENVWKSCSIQQMAFLLVQIPRLVKE